MSSTRTANAQRGFEYDSDDRPIGLVAAQRYAGLLAGGFLLTEGTAASGTRDLYTDDDGRFGPVGEEYYFDNDTSSWYLEPTGGTALIGF